MILLPYLFTVHIILHLGLGVVVLVLVELLSHGAARWRGDLQERRPHRRRSGWESKYAILFAVVPAFKTFPQRESGIPAPIQLPVLHCLHGERHRWRPVRRLLL